MKIVHGGRRKQVSYEGRDARLLDCHLFVLAICLPKRRANKQRQWLSPYHKVGA